MPTMTRFLYNTSLGHCFTSNSSIVCETYLNIIKFLANYNLKTEELNRHLLHGVRDAHINLVVAAQQAF